MCAVKGIHSSPSATSPYHFPSLSLRPIPPACTRCPPREEIFDPHQSFFLCPSPKIWSDIFDPLALEGVPHSLALIFALPIPRSFFSGLFPPPHTRCLRKGSFHSSPPFTCCPLPFICSDMSVPPGSGGYRHIVLS